MNKSPKAAAGHHATALRVPFHEPGPGGAIGIVAIANYLQQAAGEHAERLGVGAAHLAAKDLYWVLTRQFISITRMPGANEEIAIDTWPSRRPRQLFLRDFRVMDADGALLAEATSAWALIEGNTRKAIRGPSWLTGRIRYDDARAAEFPARTIPRREAHALEQAITPRWSDLDANGHVNNAQLMGYLLEPLARRLDGPGALKSFDVAFRAECGLRNDVRAQTDEIAPGRFHHTLLRDGEIEIARAESIWS